MSKQADTYKLEHNGKLIECDRVTTVLGATKASAGLSAWYAKEEREGILKLLDFVPVNEVSDDGLLEGLKARIREIKAKVDDKGKPLFFAEEVRDDKADDGTTVHHMIHRDATGEPLPEGTVITPLAQKKFENFLRFKEAEDIEYVESEMRVYSPELMVAGTLDLTVLWRGVFWLLDTKTGALKRDAATQTAIYTMLRAEKKAIEENDTKTLDMMKDAFSKGQVPKINWPRLGVLHLYDEDRAEIYEINPAIYEQLVRNFLYRLQAFRDDQTLQPFRRVWQTPKVDKTGTVVPFTPTDRWLRAS